MPKKLIADIYTGYIEDAFEDPTQAPAPAEIEAQPAELEAEAPTDLEAAV
jgi:hypothetical protein